MGMSLYSGVSKFSGCLVCLLFLVLICDSPHLVVLCLPLFVAIVDEPADMWDSWHKFVSISLAFCDEQDSEISIFSGFPASRSWMRSSMSKGLFKVCLGELVKIG